MRTKYVEVGGQIWGYQYWEKQMEKKLGTEFFLGLYREDLCMVGHQNYGPL